MFEVLAARISARVMDGESESVGLNSAHHSNISPSLCPFKEQG